LLPTGSSVAHFCGIAGRIDELVAV